MWLHNNCKKLDSFSYLVLWGLLEPGKALYDFFFIHKFLYLIIILQFIQYVAEQKQDAAIGHNLRSETAEIRLIRSKLSIGKCPVIFVDTPGFDDTYKSDIEILSLIATWLVKA